MSQQLQEARETIATRDAEVAELKSRVAELETLQKKQARLVQMKDGQLAAAQQQLQQRQQASTPAAPAPPVDGNPWLLAGAIGLPLLIVIGLGAWWMRRRRPPVAQRDEPSFAQRAPVPAEPAKPRLSDDPDLLFPAEDEPAPATPANEPASALGKPSWMGVAAQGNVVLPVSVETSPVAASPTATPSFATAARPVAPDAVPSIRHEPMPRELPPGRGVFDSPEESLYPQPSLPVTEAAIDERIALANTYLQLDDETTARRLLQEVIDERGASAEAARRLLGRIGLPP